MTYEVSGSLQDLVTLIAEAYGNWRQSGGAFKDSLGRLLDNADQYLVGQSLARV